jgi:transposase
MTTNDGDVIGGAGTHGHTHHAAAISAANGKLLDNKEFPATAQGYRQLLSWLRSFGAVVKVGVEGTGCGSTSPRSVSPSPRRRSCYAGWPIACRCLTVKLPKLTNRRLT